jgi:large subunit ribosomal protein L2
MFQLYKSKNLSKRFYINYHFNKLNKKPCLKVKLKAKVRISGKNNSGQTTIFHRGGSHKKRLRLINFYKEKINGIIFSIEYDPNRNANIASVYNYNLSKFLYIIAAKNLKVGNLLKSNSEAKKKIGHSMLLKDVPLGCPIYDVKFFSRSAGTYSIIINKYKNKAKITLNSGQYKFISLNCYCKIGIVSNETFFLKQLGKAGRSRWLGIKPTVKGISMNPVDHPNGGGEGKKSSKRKSPWGKILNSKKLWLNLILLIYVEKLN